MASGPNVALFKKNNGPFQIPGSKKKGHQKKFERIGKKARVDGPQQKKVPNFPIFGPLTTKGWRPLLYRIYYILYSIHYTVYTIGSTTK